MTEMYLLSQEIKEVRNNILGRLIPPHSTLKGGLCLLILKACKLAVLYAQILGLSLISHNTKGPSLQTVSGERAIWNTETMDLRCSSGINEKTVTRNGNGFEALQVVPRLPFPACLHPAVLMTPAHSPLSYSQSKKGSKASRQSCLHYCRSYYIIRTH